MAVRNVAAYWPPGTEVTFHHTDAKSGAAPIATGTVDSYGDIDFPEDPKPATYVPGSGGTTFYARALERSVAYGVDMSNPAPRPTPEERNATAARAQKVAPMRWRPAPGRTPYYPPYSGVHGHPDSA
jgi:hypothetical protein